MVGGAGEEGFGAIDLLEGDEEGEFVLEGLGAERPEEIGVSAGGVVPPLGGSDEEGAPRDRAVLEFLDFGSEGATGKLFSILV